MKPNRTLDLKGIKVYPILGENFGLNYGHIPLGENSPYIERFKNSTQEQINELIQEFHAEQGVTWSISGDREERVELYRENEQIMRDKRTVHIGLDIMATAGTPLFSPLDAEVFHVEYEEGEKNYGQMIILKCEDNNGPIYLLFAHLAKDGLRKVGEKLKAGEIFAYVGDFHENGNWFYHTHLQVLTEKGCTTKDIEGKTWVNKALCTPEQLDSIDEFCLSPLPLVEKSCE